MLLASAMFAVMGAAVKLAVEHGASLALVVLFRGLPSVLFLLVYARAGRRSLAPGNWRLHVWRNVAGISSMWLGFYAVSQLPLATATSLNYTAPLFIACWMLGWGGAQRDAVRIAAVVFGFVGVITILRPSISGDQWQAAALGLVAGATAAVAVMQIRQLGRMGEPEWRTVLFFSFAVSLSSIAGLFAMGWGAADWYGYAALCGIGISGLVAQMAQTRAFGVGSALLTAALQYSTIIFAALIGVAFWGDRLDGWAWIGMGLIIGAGLLSIWRTMRDPRELPPRGPKPAGA
jgi:S-adenosylmethionine uptake transporter